MVEAIAADLAELLVKDFNMSIAESLDTLYNSRTYAILSDSRSGLYFQSPRYVYSFLQKEMETGRIA